MIPSLIWVGPTIIHHLGGWRFGPAVIPSFLLGARHFFIIRVRDHWVIGSIVFNHYRAAPHHYYPSFGWMGPILYHLDRLWWLHHWMGVPYYDLILNTGVPHESHCLGGCAHCVFHHLGEWAHCDFITSFDEPTIIPLPLWFSHFAFVKKHGSN